MDSTRQQRFARLIQKEMGDIFQKEGRNIFGNSFITITQVKVTPDLSIARIYLSTFHENGQAVLDKVHARKNEIRHHLGIRIRNQVKSIPDLEFFIDDTLDKAEHMDEVFRKLNIPPADDQNSSN